jgi:hypothetical protein
MENPIKIDIKSDFSTSDNLYFWNNKINFIQNKKLKLILSKLFSQKLFNVFFAKKIYSKIISIYCEFKNWLDFSWPSPKRMLSSLSIIITNGKYLTSLYGKYPTTAMANVSQKRTTRGQY